MSEPAMTSAANVEEGNEVRVGGRYMVCEQAESDGETVTLWLGEFAYTFPVDRQLSVVK